MEGWFNYGDELPEIPDQLVLSKDPVTVDGRLMWNFHSMTTGEEFFIKYEASIRDIYNVWQMMYSKM